MLVIGCGNPDRSDDAAGILVARRLRELGIQAHELCGEGLALIDAWSGWADVIVVDAVKSGAPPGTITIWDARVSPLPVSQFGCSSHRLGVGEGIELARTLDRLPGKLMVVGIEGIQFSYGGSVSAEVAEAVERVARRIAEQDIVQEVPMLGILVHGDNHFIVRGPRPDRETALALVHHWSLIRIGGETPAALRSWRISTKEFREDLEWAIVVPDGRAASPAVEVLLEELRARGISILEIR
jgi:hydrogenase maturation protease